MDGKAGYGAGGWEKQLDSLEEFGNGGIAVGPVKQTADQGSRDKVWRQLHRQGWAMTGVLIHLRGKSHGPGPIVA